MPDQNIKIKEERMPIFFPPSLPQEPIRKNNRNLNTSVATISNSKNLMYSGKRRIPIMGMKLR